MKKTPSTPSVFPSAAEDREHAERHPLDNPSYRLAYADADFLARDDLRAVRLQLEWLKPDLLQEEHNINSTVVIFGGARFREAGDGNAGSNARFYHDARELAQKITQLSLQHRGEDYVVVTGGGPGIMEAANRGAADVGGKSIGLNIVLPHEQQPNPYITPELCFQFHYFAVRKMHFLKRAKGLVAFPGGFGTLDELFETLTLIQTRKIKPVPVVLVGTHYWNSLINFEFLVEQGAIAAEDIDLIYFTDSVDDAFSHLKERWDV